MKEIVKRITEIQTQFINAGDKLGMLQQTTMPELTNLLDEAIIIANNNPKYLNDSEYATIINMAFQTNKTEDLEELINNGLAASNDITTEYGLLNLHARYYFNIKKNPEIGRQSILKVIQKSKEQQINEVMKVANIALEYYYWSIFEFGIDNFEMADSLLTIAEDMVINTECVAVCKFSCCPTNQ